MGGVGGLALKGADDHRLDPGTFVISWERKMSVVVQYVVRPNPGTDPAKITELAKEGAVLWRKHGGKLTHWTVAVGEVGNRVLSITFENFAAYTKSSIDGHSRSIDVASLPMAKRIY
jgi:hypothetical protein